MAKERKPKTDRAKKKEEAEAKTDVAPIANIEKQYATSQMLLRGPITFETKRKKVILNPTDIPLETYDEMILDPGIIYPLTILKLPTIRSEFIYTNPNKDIENFVKEVMKPIWTSLKRDCLTAYEYGFSVIEKRYYRDSNNMARYRKGVAILPSTVRIIINNEGTLLGIIQKSPRLRQAVEIPIWKLFVYTHQKRFGNHYGNSRLRPAYNPWVLDMELMKFHGLAAQDHAVPTVIGRAPMGKGTFSDSQGNDVQMNFLDFIQTVAESVQSNSSVSFPSGEEFSLGVLDLKRGAIWDFIKDHNFFDSAKARAIFGFDEIMKAGGGSYAKTKEIAGWLIEGIESIQDEIATEYILPYMIRPLIMWNFWDGGAIPPMGEFVFSPFTRNVRSYLESVFSDVITDSKEKVDIDELGRVLKVPMNKDVQELYVPEWASHRQLEDAFKKTYNISLTATKRTEGCEQEFVPQPKQDLDYIRDLSKKTWAKIDQKQIDTVGIIREFKKVKLLAQQRVMDFLDKRSFSDEEEQKNIEQ